MHNVSGSSLIDGTPTSAEEPTPTPTADEKKEPKAPVNVVNVSDEDEERTSTQFSAKNEGDEQNEPKLPIPAVNALDEEFNKEPTPTPKLPSANEGELAADAIQAGIDAVASMMEAQDSVQSAESPVLLRDMFQTSKKRKNSDHGEWLLC